MPDGRPTQVNIDRIAWCPVGPFDDPAAHLMAPLFLGSCAMVLHAVAATFSIGEARMIASAPMKQFLIGAAEQIGGGPTPLRTVIIQGREYVLIAVPNIDSRRLS